MLKMVNPEYITISEKFNDSWDTELKKLGVRYIGLTEFSDKNGNNSYYFKDSVPRKPFSGLKVF